MATRSLNKVLLIGNLTRDPELRYTPSGTAVCTFGLATNRAWTTDAGEKKEDVEFHRIVAWGKLAELCSQLLFKGRKTYLEGRVQTRDWTGQDGVQRRTTEIVISDMIVLDSNRPEENSEKEEEVVSGSQKSQSEKKPQKEEDKEVESEEKDKSQEKGSSEEKQTSSSQENTEEEVNPEDIPF